MKKPYIISVDSTADVPAAIIEKYGIEVVPLYVNLGEKSYRDGIEITNADIEKYVEETGKLPTTSAPDPATFIDYFADASQRAEFVIYFSISSELSCSYQNACLAASDFDNVYVIDSRSLCVGEAISVIKACELAKEGKTPHEIVEYINTYKTKINGTFVIDKLDYLHKGGRCSAAAALGANVLQLKPTIELRGGKLEVGKKYRGKFAKVVASYVEERLADAKPVEDYVFLAYTRCDDAVVQAAKNALEASGLFKNIITADAGSTIFCHCGPSTLGIMFADENFN